MDYDSNVDLQKGDLLFVFIDNKPVAFSSSCGLSLSKDTIDTANKMSGGWVTSQSGKKSWTMSSEALLTKKTGVLSFDALFAAFNSSTPVEVVYGQATDTFDLSAGWYTGKAHITKLDQKADNGANCTSSVEFTGTGELVSNAVAPVVAVKAAQSYTAGSGFKQLVFTVDGVDMLTGGVWEVTTPKSGVGVTKAGEIFADAGTTAGTIAVKVTYAGTASAIANVTIAV
jgi:Phage major tail protein 2.